MRSSKVLLALALLAVAGEAHAQQTAQGYAVERFYPSAPGGGWFVMDTLDLHGTLGGAASATVGYSASPVLVTNGPQRLAVVSDDVFADLGFAVMFLDRFRFYLNFPMPLQVTGQSGVVGNYQYNAPNVTIGNNPDTIGDVRLGFDARLLGKPDGPIRFGAGAQLYLPSGNLFEYDTDNNYRGMIRLLLAGDIKAFTYAAQLGVHIRTRDDTPVPEAPQGSELLFGAAAGVRYPLFGQTFVVVGPEVYGATAFAAPFGGGTTAFEGLLGARIEGRADHVSQVRVKLGLGAGLNEHFGTPSWRIVFAVEMFAWDVVKTARPATPP